MKKILLMLIVCLSTTFMTSCEEIVKKTYYMSMGEMSTNCTANLYLQALILQNIKDSSGTSEMFFGEESDAIAWFDQKCNEFIEPSFTADIPILSETWVDMELLDIGSSNTVIKTTRLTFPE